VNSSVSWWITRQAFASKQGGFYEFNPMYVSSRPIPPIPPDKLQWQTRLAETPIWLHSPAGKKAKDATTEEGQFFERKAAWDRSVPRPKPRKAADLARDIAETLCAMANADGGALVVGIEDGGAATGVALAEDKLLLLLGVRSVAVAEGQPRRVRADCRSARRDQDGPAMEARHREAERSYTAGLTHGQLFVLRELRILYEAATDEDIKQKRITQIRPD
jgi:hypothetical protein